MQFQSGPFCQWRECGDRCLEFDFGAIPSDAPKEIAYGPLPSNLLHDFTMETVVTGNAEVSVAAHNRLATGPTYKLVYSITSVCVSKEVQISEQFSRKA